VVPKVVVRKALLTLVVMLPGAALAQPTDPYAPAPPAPAPKAPAAPAPKAPTPAPKTPAPAPAPKTPAPAPNAPEDPYGATGRASDDPVLAEQVAQQLVARAQELFEAKILTDAKQLAVEALVRSPKGAAAEHARYLLKAINHELGIADEPEPQPKVDTTPIEDPIKPEKPPEQPAPERWNGKRISATVHGAEYGGLLGATIGSFFKSSNAAAGAIPTGLALGIGAGLGAPKLADTLDLNEAQIRTVGAGITWGGVIGGLFGDAVTLLHTNSRAVLVGSSIGATVGMGAGYAYSRQDQLTRGDVALVDTMAGIGTVGGLTIGMLMQPAKRDAYAVNSIVGATAGVITGIVAAPQTNTTPRRMLRVAGLSAAGGAVPFLLYAAIHDPHSTADERVTGALSTAGLLVGAYIGFRLTEHMDEGLDTPDGKKHDVVDAPVAVIGRSSNGNWNLGGLGIQPLSPQLAPQPGAALQVFGAAF
jgi:hypothetical protein